MPTPQPFHESIVHALRLARHRDDLQCLLQLIGTTKIPVNHDEILQVMCEACERFGLTGPDDLSKHSLLAQKREADAKREKGCLTEAEREPLMLEFLPAERQSHVRFCTRCFALLLDLPPRKGSWWTEALDTAEKERCYP